MSDGNGLAEALLGLEGFRVLKVSETPAELVVEVETTADLVGCGGCGTLGRVPGPHGRGDPRPGLLRQSGSASLAQASLALHRGRL